MKCKTCLLICFFLLSFQLFSQAHPKLTKENICKGAAISIVANLKPFVDRGLPKSEVVGIGKELVKDVIKDSPTKAYDLLKKNTSSDAVIAILYDDFMKLDENVVLQFLIKPDEDEEY